MLAATVDSVERLLFPLIATPKFDGIRCLTIHPSTKGKRCKAVTRKWKPIPNLHIRELIETNCPPGLDGELMTTGEFFDVSSGIMSAQGKPDFSYNIFDVIQSYQDLNLGYVLRLKNLNKLFQIENWRNCPWLKYVPYTLIHCPEQLTEYEEACLVSGYEGVMLRAPLSSYKCGRSTFNEAKLLKLKRVDQSEGYVVAVFEEEANLNPIGLDAFGYAKRSSHQENKQGKGRAGGFIVSPNPINASDLAWALQHRDYLRTAVQKHPTFFSVGSGFTDEMKSLFWVNRPISRKITYSHQKIGMKSGGKPRFTRFKGFRDERD